MNILIPKRNKLIAVVSLGLVFICITGTVLKIRGKNTVDPKRANEYILGELNDENLVGALYCGDFRVVTLNKKPGKTRLAHFDEKGEVISESDNENQISEFQKNDACNSFALLRARIESCSHMNVSIINRQIEQFHFAEGTWPRDDLEDIKTNLNYFPDGIPTCPVDLTSYVLKPSPYHRVSGHRRGEGTHNYSDRTKNVDWQNIKTLFDLFSKNEDFVIFLRDKHRVYAMTFDDSVFVFDIDGNFIEKLTDNEQIENVMKLLTPKFEKLIE